MKTKNLFHELLIIAFAMIPLIYLAAVWHLLPSNVPIHYDYKGEADRYDSKSTMATLVILMNLCVYFIMRYAPVIDPKKRFDQFMQTYKKLRLIIAILISGICCFMIYSGLNRSNENMGTFLFPFICILFVLLGNYMSTIRPNYFIGVRTPWTLENEIIWKKTHELTGKLWFWSGLVAFIIMLIIPKETKPFMLVGFIVIDVLIPVIYSYLLYRRIANETVKSS